MAVGWPSPRDAWAGVCAMGPSPTHGTVRSQTTAVPHSHSPSELLAPLQPPLVRAERSGARGWAGRGWGGQKSSSQQCHLSRQGAVVAGCRMSRASVGCPPWGKHCSLPLPWAPPTWCVPLYGLLWHAAPFPQQPHHVLWLVVWVAGAGA